MSPKAFLVLAAITVIATVGAVLAVLSQPTATTLRFVDEPAFPALRENPDAVAKVTLTTPEGTITLVRETGDRWSALERYGTRAQTALRFALANPRIDCVVVGLAELSHLEEALAAAEMGPLPDEALAELRQVYAGGFEPA